jgi:CRP-like cAMP-binding protein
MLNAFKTYIERKGTISDAGVESINPLPAPKKITRGTIILQQGEVCRHFIFVAKGCLRSYINGATTRAHILEFIPENNWITDYTSLFRESGSIFSIDAVEDSEIIMVEIDFYNQILAMFPDFQMQYVQHIHTSIRNIQERLTHLLGSSGHERYLDFLEKYPELGLRLPQHMIASYLGISPESLSRIRNRLAQK